MARAGRVTVVAPTARGQDVAQPDVWEGGRGGPAGRTDGTGSDRRPDGAVLLVDSEEMFAQSLRFALEAQGDLEVVETADTLRPARAVMATVSPDVVVLESRLPDGAGIAADPRHLRRACPASKVVLLTSGPDASVAAEAVGARSAGRVPRTGTLDELVAAVRGVAAGQVDASPGVLAKLLPRLQRVTQRPGWDLTARELEILQLLGEGLSNAAIAARLVVSVHTVRNHVQNLLSKLGAHSKLEALVIALREGLLRGDWRGPR